MGVPGPGTVHNMGTDIRTIALSAAGTAFSILLLVLSCVVNNEDKANNVAPNWWPALVCIPYIMAPIPAALSGQSLDTLSSSPSVLVYWCHFTTGCIVTASFGMLVVMAHADVINIIN